MVSNSRTHQQLRRRSAGGHFTLGNTLQSSVSSRQATPRFSMDSDDGGGGDDVSINYANLDDMFREEDSSSIGVARVAKNGGQYNALTHQRSDAHGDLELPPTLRQMVGFYLDTSATGRRWDQADALLNTVIACLHIYNTTHVRAHHLYVPLWSLLAEAVASFLLLLQFIPRYLLAPDPLEYLRSQFSVITLATALTPICVLANVWWDPAVYDSTFMSAGTWVFLYPVIFWRLQPALLRCLVPIKNVYRLSPMTRNVLRALTTVFTTVLAITVLTHIMVYYQNKDKDDEVEGFDEAFFFIAVSAITGLSSDIEPDTWFTRGVVLFVMFIGIFWLPPRVSEMLSLWEDRSPWPSQFEQEANQAHVLVIGDLAYSTLFEFLREFFCEDHGLGTVNTVVVLMSEKEPGKEVGELLADPSYVNRVKFVLGSPTSFQQLEDVEAHRAKGIFLLSSKAAAAGSDAKKEDAAKVMIALAVRKFLKSRVVPIYAQVLLPETTTHLEYLTDHVVCIDELRLGLLAKSVLVPGFASLLQLLTTSIPDNTTGPLMRVAEQRKLGWLSEYVGGMRHEIYATRFSSMFVGVRFQRAAHVIYQRTGATLFAIQVPDEEDEEDGDGRIMINPQEYEIGGDEMGFVITANSLISTHIAYLSEEWTIDVEEEPEPPVDITLDRFSKHQPEDGHAHSPLHKKLMERGSQIKSHVQVPFGMNVMDTVVVAESQKSRASSAIKSVKSAVEGPEEPEGGDDDDGDGDGDGDDDDDDLIDLEGSGELSKIQVEDKGKGKEPEEEPEEQIKRAPLLFDPKLQKSSEIDLVSDNDQVEPTVDGLPGDLSKHIVVCDTSEEFPSNIIYLVSCIRAAAPSEVATTLSPAADEEEEEGKEGEEDSPQLSSNPFASLYEQISRTYNNQTAEEQPAFLNMQPIVILSAGEATDAQTKDLERFGNLYVVNGSPLSRSDLARVRTHTAGCAIVLANREESADAAIDQTTKLSLAGSDTTATATADAPALLSVLNIEALTYTNPDFFMTVEFIHRENMQFVGDTDTIRINEVYAQAFLRPSFMAGRVYAPVMLDTLVCQAYYNQHLLEILRRLVFSHGNVVHALDMAKLSEAGIEEVPGVDDDADSKDTGHVFLCPVHERFVGCSYSSLFSYCCFKHSAIPIGLYRPTLHHRQPLWYVLVNPDPQTELRKEDKVYLLADTKPVVE